MGDWLPTKHRKISKPEITHKVGEGEYPRAWRAAVPIGTSPAGSCFSHAVSWAIFSWPFRPL